MFHTFYNHSTEIHFRKFTGKNRKTSNENPFLLAAGQDSNPGGRPIVRSRKRDRDHYNNAIATIHVEQEICLYPTMVKLETLYT